MAVDATGARTPQPFHAAANPPIDCFYVYPTVSREPSDLADMQETAEITSVVRAQAARFTSKCRLYAPIYRQMTLAGLRRALKPGAAPISWQTTYEDVRAAWRSYLKHDNHGRGVILIGHSQGSLMLTRLIAEEIDGKPAQALLVSAMLAGDPAMTVAANSDRGGSFKSIPLCHRASQTGCAMAWSTYLDTDASSPRFFGRNPGPGLQAVCVNPAAPQGGRAALKGYLRKPAIAPAGDPPYIETVAQATGACASDAQGSVLRLHVQEGPYADQFRAFLARLPAPPGWGLHNLDIGAVQGNMLDLMESETAAWIAKRH